jgi:hypothetical protein
MPGTVDSMRRSALLLVALAGAALGSLAAGTSRAEPPAPREHRASVTEGLDCSACHVPDGWKSMGAASGSSGFDHSRTGFPLTGRHGTVACTGCHRGERAISRRCADCHQDEHQGRLGASCDDCHSAAGWQTTDAMARHRRTRLPLTGMHALTECRDCHQRTSERTWTTPPADCYACHAADYRRVDVHPPHFGVPGDPDSPPFSRNCSECHHPTGWLPAFLSGNRVQGDFDPTGRVGLALGAGAASPAASVLSVHERFFPIATGPHRGADCGSCHAVRATPRAVRCTGCHSHGEAVLREQHREVLGFGGACLVCHPGGRAR